jgi:hypothetical protein
MALRMLVLHARAAGHRAYRWAGRCHSRGARDRVAVSARSPLVTLLLPSRRRCVVQGAWKLERIASGRQTAP